MSIPAADYNAVLVTATGSTGVHIVQQQHLFDVHTDRTPGRAPESDIWVAVGFGYVKAETVDIVVAIDGASRADVQVQLDALRQVVAAATAIRLYREDHSTFAFERPVFGLGRFYPESPIGAFGYRVRMGFAMKPPRTMGWLVDSSGVRLADSSSETLSWSEVW